MLSLSVFRIIIFHEIFHEIVYVVLGRIYDSLIFQLPKKCFPFAISTQNDAVDNNSTIQSQRGRSGLILGLRDLQFTPT